MGDLLRDGLRWLDQQRQAHGSGAVTYSRGLTSATVAATYGRTELELHDEAGFSTRAMVVDFLITAAAMPVDAPKVGDTILADGVTYEVMNLPGDGCWRWCDPYRITMRIHTKEV